MDREFLDLYERELRVLREQAREFAEEFPGIADRLGGLMEDRTDPMIQGLLEGAAFLAARVQLKIKHEFPEFTTNLLDQLIPNFLMPTPSAMVVQARPIFGDPALLDGTRIAKGSYLDATYLERERRVACRYRLTAEIMLWPFEMTAADYLATPAALQAIGVPLAGRARAGLRLGFTTRMSGRKEAEISDQDAIAKPEFHAARCRISDLVVHLVGDETEAIALYEQLFARRVGIHLRYYDEFGDAVVLPIDPRALVQVGFEEGEGLVPPDTRIFHGFALVKDFFVFSRRFLAFRLVDLDKILPRVPAKSFEIVISFDESNPRLQATLTLGDFGIYAAPAVNLFEMTLDRIQVKSNLHEHHVVPDRSRPIDFEPHRLLDVAAHYAGSTERVPVLPLYSAPRDPDSKAGKLFYTVRRLPRRRTALERRTGGASDYTGTEMYLSLLEPRGRDVPQVAEISLRALCSNRHLTEALPVGEGGADFRLLDNTDMDFVCLAGPTPPAEPVTGELRSRREVASTGTVTWRLINMLSLNHLGLIGRSAGRNAQSLREMLGLFADLKDAVQERRIDGIRSVDSRPIVRRVRRATGVGAARGLEITVTIDERSFEGSGIFLLGAVLDRFFAEYVAINNFTQTVIRSVERGEIMRWPVRLGLRRPL
ncbi:type VI secretion system baseplate subunit TssF [Prosthecomicrobium sp. N25]|uniref:type VI secretion system baseplate subunit TssF n=1 Tax=Prosthecomicrobium sp. N25 TaxID=3129254 RepID=UPI0030781D24